MSRSAATFEMPRFVIFSIRFASEKYRLNRHLSTAEREVPEFPRFELYHKHGITQWYSGIRVEGMIAMNCSVKYISEP